MKELIRLNKAIAQSGFCSRREADRYIEQGVVFVNGRPAEVGQKVTPRARIKINGKPISFRRQRVYLAFNKPVGVTSTTDKKDRDNMIDYINYPERIFHIGRLDKDSEGLIFLTNDGDIVNKILRAENGHEKEYIVTVDKNISPYFIENMAKGVPILGEITLPCQIEQLNKRTFKIVLTQGLNRQIRRMCAHFNYEVVSLRRTRIMNIYLGNLPVGDWRFFTDEELQELESLLDNNS